MTSSVRPSEVLPSIVALARQAANRIIKVYRGEFAVTEKADGSPLTRADLDSHEVLVSGLQEITPGVPVVSEESPLEAFKIRSQWSDLWLIDPLDGTRGFTRRNDEFVVCIALVRENRPVLGVVYAPIGDICYFASTGNRAYKQIGDGPARTIQINTKRVGPTVVTTSSSRFNSATEAFIENLGSTQLLPMGSALKPCYIAEGRADIYPGFSQTCEWDTAAAQCVLERAGGGIVDLTGMPLTYNNKQHVNNPHFVALGDPHLSWRHHLPESLSPRGDDAASPQVLAKLAGSPIG